MTGMRKVLLAAFLRAVYLWCFFVGAWLMVTLLQELLMVLVPSLYVGQLAPTLF